ncbi:zf-C2H2_3 domain-containing protein (plasmid) [Rhodovastum atsumiense]|uniref:C2H2-type zinc finger protein n=1 Tax=Rhodovastum atsumiense TaxID=504468 RepID=UPI00139F2A36|nr:C2H2-type zinc finger protein [Rhodovastum atsumiense]CAH2606076.1 zf-C2H2_3 domain-containing protein [Rhodovastum atsumiense]
MTADVAPNVLDAIWAALKAPSERSFAGAEGTRIAHLLRDRWIDRVCVSDLIEDHDQRLRDVDLGELARIAGVPFRMAYRLTGRKTQRYFSGSEAMAPADAAAFMIWLERLGFAVDPSAMVAAVLPTLKGLERATDGEVDVLNFAHSRHRMFPLTLERAGAVHSRGKTEALKTPAHYRAEAAFGADGVLLRLTVHAPRYRLRPEPELTRCDECGMSYMKGDPDDGVIHRAHHKKTMRILQPSPDTRAAAALAKGWTGEVGSKSPRWMQDAMYRRAVAFKREMGYDFPQWDPKGEREPTVRGHLFVDPDGTIQGACCFRWRERNQAGWWLDWIWLAKGARRRGILTRHWAGFRAAYGAFRIEPPLSEAMQAFAAKAGVPFAQVPL